MGQEAKIVDKLDGNKFVIELEEKEFDGSPSPVRLTFAHDYVQIEASCPFQIDESKTNYTNPKGTSNWVGSRAAVQIPIRDFKQTVLPLLFSTPFLQNEHFEPREYSEDDVHFEKCGETEPRWKKGDKYPPYAHTGGIIEYYDESTKTRMVAFRRAGETTVENVTKELFDQIRPILKLSYTKWEMKEQKEE